MGCGSSAQAEELAPVPGREKPEPRGFHSQFLTGNQKKIIRSTWQQFKEGNYLQDASYIFVILFREMPETIKLFDFVSSPKEDELLKNPRLDTHVLRVTNTIGLAVDNLNDPDTLAMVANELGRRHVSYGAKPAYLGAVVNGVIYSLQRKLQGAMTEEATQAWLELLSFIGSYMVEGMKVGEQEQTEKMLRTHSSML